MNSPRTRGLGTSSIFPCSFGFPMLLLFTIMADCRQILRKCAERLIATGDRLTVNTTADSTLLKVCFSPKVGVDSAFHGSQLSPPWKSIYLLSHFSPWNRPFPSCLLPLFQTESKCEIFHMKMSMICIRMDL